MNTTAPDAIAEIAERHKAELSRLSAQRQKQVMTAIGASVGMLLTLDPKDAEMALRHITEAYNACKE